MVDQEKFGMGGGGRGGGGSGSIAVLSKRARSARLPLERAPEMSSIIC